MIAHTTVNGKRVRCYGNTEVVLSFTRYPRNGRICLRLMRVEDGQEGDQVAVCTVNLPAVPMKPDEVAVKTWYENVGMFGWLRDEGVVSDPLHYAYFANVFIPVCALLIQSDNVV